MLRRVVITGIGAFSPLGNAPDVIFAAAMEGRTGAALLRHQELQVPAVVAKVDFDPSPWFNRLQLAGVDRVSQMAVAASQMAQQDAGQVVSGDMAGVYVGCGMGGAAAMDKAYSAHAAAGRIPPLTVPAFMPNAPAGHVAMRAHVGGPVLTYSIACASSAVAIAEAANAIARGDIDTALAGGSEALLIPSVIRAWQALHTLASPQGRDPERVCRPFSTDRSGFVLGEGAAFLVLETLEAAQSRGARIYAELAGSGISCDASHLTKPDVAGQVKALRAALRNSKVAIDDITYCNAHGTATQIGDAVECDALNAVWGDAIEKLRVSSTKSVHGHLLGGAGALEAAITAIAVAEQAVPPQAHLTEQDPACRVRLAAAGEILERGIPAAISNSFAFGGTNAVLVFRRVN